MFELYNEPHDVELERLEAAAPTRKAGTAVGMQQLYDTVRATGAENLVVIGGLNWAYDLSGVPANRIAGYNIVYATHPYTDPAGPARRRTGTRLGLPDRDRSGRSRPSSAISGRRPARTDYSAQLIRTPTRTSRAGPRGPGIPGGCTFPALIDDWAGTPSPTGTVVKAALLGYPDDPPASPPRPLRPRRRLHVRPRPAGLGVQHLRRSVATKSGRAPAGGRRPPALSFNAVDGTPDPGALQVTVGFTALDQYVDPNINFLNPRLNLTGKVLHARIKLVSGSFAQGAFQFHASTGDSFAYGSTFFGADTLRSASGCRSTSISAR